MRRPSSIVSRSSLGSAALVSITVSEYVPFAASYSVHHMAYSRPSAAIRGLIFFVASSRVSSITTDPAPQNVSLVRGTVESLTNKGYQAVREMPPLTVTILVGPATTGLPVAYIMLKLLV